MPFYLYGFSDSTTDFDLTTSLGVITLISGGTALQVQEAAQDNTFQQWYIVPTSGVSAVIQNVATQQYLQGNTGNNTLTVINGIQSATQFNIQLETQAGPMGGGTGVANGVSFNGNPGATAYYINISGGGTSVIFYPDSTIQSNDIWVMLPAISDVF
ncbi:Hypothetical protein HVR_LOCUS806 [uncultured virus]|nr:Hypothetical protein HVR_LOCUS806 [uncultured virus]